MKPDWDAQLLTLETDEEDINVVALSPDGQLLVWASSKAIHLWHAATGTRLHTFHGHTEVVTHVGFVADGQSIVSGSKDETVRIWSVTTGSLLHTLPDIGHIVALASSPDGSLLAVSSHGWGTATSTVNIWHTETGEHHKTVEIPVERLSAPVALSTDIRRFASVHLSSNIQLWDLETGEIQSELKEFASSVLHLAFSPDSNLLASASFGDTVRIWNLQTFTQVCLLEGQCWPVAFSPNSQLLLSTSLENRICFWDTRSGEFRSTVPHPRSVSCVSWRGNIIASAISGTIRLFDTTTGTNGPTLTEPQEEIHCMGVSHDGQVVVTVGREKLQLWDSTTNSYLMTPYSEGHEVSGIAFSPDSKLLGVSKYGSVEIWCVKTCTYQKTLAGVDQTVPHGAVSYSTDGKLAAVVTFNKIRLQSSINGAYICTFEGHVDTVDKIMFSSDNRIIASSSLDNTIRLWDTKIGKSRHTLNLAKETPGMWTISANGDLIALVTPKSVKWWDTVTGVSNQFVRDSFDVERAALSLSLQLLASARNFYLGSCIDLHDLTTSEHVAILSYHGHHIQNLVFSPDGRFIAAGLGLYFGFNVTSISIRSARNYTELHRLQGNCEFSGIIQFSPDGEMIAAAFKNRTVLLWRTSTGERLRCMRHEKGIVRGITFLPGEIVLSISQDMCGSFYSPWDPMTVESCRFRIDVPQLDFIGLDGFHEWIAKGPDNMVLLPPEYHPKRDKVISPESFWASRGSAVFISRVSGRFVRFEIE